MSREEPPQAKLWCRLYEGTFCGIANRRVIPEVPLRQCGSLVLHFGVVCFWQAVQANLKLASQDIELRPSLARTCQKDIQRLCVASSSRSENRPRVRLWIGHEPSGVDVKC
mgnify:CR=1 FL=1